MELPDKFYILNTDGSDCYYLNLEEGERIGGLMDTGKLPLFLKFNEISGAPIRLYSNRLLSLEYTDGDTREIMTEFDDMIEDKKPWDR